MSEQSNDRWAKVRTFLVNRKRAYALTFNKESVPVQAVLADLMKFCRANETTFHPDPRIHAVLEGRREVFLRIINHLNLSAEDLLKIYAQKDSL